MQFIDWGLVPYRESDQLALVEQIASGKQPNTVVFCSHPPVVTLGRKSDRAADLCGWNGEVVEVRRGGKATYHGPSQVIVYPLFNLENPSARFSRHDVMGLISYLEDVTVAVLKSLNILGVPGSAFRRKLANHSSEIAKPSGTADQLMTGVWIGEKKICSIGIAVSKWVSFHGLALNLDEDDLAFGGINPCGFKTSTMTSVQAQLRKKVPREKVVALYKSEFSSLR